MRPGVDYLIEKLDLKRQTSRFSLGAELDLRPLKSFLQHNALSYQNANIAVTYVATLPPVDEGARSWVIDYISLTCSETYLGDSYSVVDCEHANRYPSMPALKIARLASHADYTGHCIGQTLVDFAIALAADHIGASAGCRFLVTDTRLCPSGPVRSACDLSTNCKGSYRRYATRFRLKLRAAELQCRER